jgi:hypothetical protein
LSRVSRPPEVIGKELPHTRVASQGDGREVIRLDAILATGKERVDHVLRVGSFRHPFRVSSCLEVVPFDKVALHRPSWIGSEVERLSENFLGVLPILVKEQSRLFEGSFGLDWFQRVS